MGRNNHGLDLDEEELWSFENDETVPEPETLYRVLIDQDRRRILYCLLEGDERSPEEIADILVGWQLFQEDVADEDDWKRKHTQLVHVHLPMIAASGLIEYDADAGETEIASLPDPVRDLIRFTQKYDESIRADEIR